MQTRKLTSQPKQGIKIKNNLREEDIQENKRLEVFLKKLKIIGKSR